MGRTESAYEASGHGGVAERLQTSTASICPKRNVRQSAWDWRGRSQLSRAAFPAPSMIGTYTHRGSVTAPAYIPGYEAR
ncbi:hypothetical protein AG0111_0g11739 [Alternaria gaisen]|uniref:Uncharacterized protein n=2 Tax=Alternaria gaisen TaxID=167740 RepID=A0ACB6F6S4_9PLEO|nr:hypothetical protein AG0111_0g11765 [Alternaria gaisen]KAB2100137.1 hypothetical protein AG0111_0g11739 [Alternaria gaisen]